MPDSTIHNLPESTTGPGTSEAVGSFAGVTKKITFANLAAALALLITALAAGTTIGGKNVCLQDGTNCPSASTGAQTLVEVTNAGNFATSSVLFYGGATTADLTATGTASLQGVSFTSGTGTSVQATSGTVGLLAFTNATGGRLNVTTQCIGGDCKTAWPAGFSTTSWYGPIEWSDATGTNTTSTSLGVTGISSLAVLNFTSATGSDLFAATGRFTTATGSTVNANISGIGNLTVQWLTSPSSTFTNATATRLFATTLLTSSFTANATGATSTNIAWTGTASGTSLFANSATFGSLLIGTQSVCLANGTNCPFASIAETNTGTLTTKGVTPDGLAGSTFGKRLGFLLLLLFLFRNIRRRQLHPSRLITIQLAGL